jgi:hypothetical protein
MFGESAVLLTEMYICNRKRNYLDVLAMNVCFCCDTPLDAWISTVGYFKPADVYGVILKNKKLQHCWVVDVLDSAYCQELKDGK